jgi:hypothetical protein
MGSPLRVIRKNKKLLMAISTVLAMFAFLFIGPWSQFGAPATTIKNPEVFTWKYGTVTQADVYHELALRHAVNNFLRATAAELQTPEANMRAREIGDPTESSVVQSMIYAKKAEQLGIVPDDAAINNLLEYWTEGRIPQSRIVQIMRRISVPDSSKRESRTLKEHELFDTLRKQLQASYVQQAVARQYGRNNGRAIVFAGDTPADRWHYYLQLNRKATVQVFPVAVADFVSQVSDPSDQTLQAFYDQYKNTIAGPVSPTPGFRQPAKAKFQYFKVNYEKLVAEEMPKVTEQEIKDYYEANKDRDYRKKRLPELPPEGAALPGENPGETTAPPTGEQTPPMETSTGKDVPAAKADEKSPPTAGAKTEGDKATEMKSDAKKTDSPKASLPKTPKSDGKSAPKGKQSSQLRKPASLDGELLALADEVLLAQKTDAKTPATKPADTKATDAKAAETKAADAKAPDTQTPDTQTPTTSIPLIEYEPLEKVAEEVRKHVAEQKVDDRIQKAFTPLMERVNKYRSELGRFRVKLGPEPAPLDIAALAKEFDVEAKDTAMISAQQAYDETDIGRSQGQISLTTFRAPSFIEMAYATRAPIQTFEPKESEDIDRNRYLWWKTAERAENTPALADIKTEVVQAWKMIEARKPAKAKAEEYAKQVQEANLPMRDVLTAVPGAEVATAGPFSWLDRSLGQTPEMSKVSGVKDPGNEFMRTVFSLDPNQTGVAPNFPENTFYVVQLESTAPPLDELENGFMSAMASPMSAQTYAVVGALDHRYDAAAWLKELEDQFEVKSVRSTEPEEGEGD